MLVKSGGDKVAQVLREIESGVGRVMVAARREERKQETRGQLETK